MHKPIINVKIINDFEGEFVLEPLERGFGHTLGNSIRRVLLSSIEGAGITKIRIENVQHEFSTLEGLKEDIIELVGNLRQIVFKMELSDLAIVKVNKSGPCEITAADISLPAEVEIINKDCYIGTLSKNGNLKVEMVVEKGKGYRNAEENISQGDPIGVIPVDTVFSPIRRVMFKVENTRVGQMTNFDKLTMTIKTNGSIKPEEALSQSSKIINDYMSLMIDLSEKTKNEDPIFEKIEQKAKKQQYPSIEDLELSVRSYNCLKRAGIDSVEKLLQYTEDELLDIRNFGQKSIQEVKNKVSELGLSFKKK
ncbi:MAG: DNA-directed RNA polymerase subunit alpha [Actinobacteria bacterium]|nr:DNA-directed RNA polymerase subunit alpha [Actinomycetota bacterium]MCL6087300.1 DNA-directed RNA polymerase subunit alpha [Actinomycetota bacterium]